MRVGILGTTRSAEPAARRWQIPHRSLSGTAPGVGVAEEVGDGRHVPGTVAGLQRGVDDRAVRRQRHPGSEFGFLLSGELVLTLGFEEMTLRPGDAVSFESTTPHRYRNDATEPAVGVWYVIED